MNHSWIVLTLAMLAACSAPRVDLPTANPVAAYYDGAEGYPAWTDRIPWSRVIDMATYPHGGTDFERFERARDDLATRGGGVLYYPAGVYDFTDMPADGPAGRGLMLAAGVVIRGAEPAGRPNAAADHDLTLGTRFVFGYRSRGGGRLPRDWNLIGLSPEQAGGVGAINDVGICWVHLVGATVYFGPEFEWSGTWGEAGGWRSRFAKPAWQSRRPDGSHPGDPFMAGPVDIAANGGRDPDGSRYRLQPWVVTHGRADSARAGSGRLVFGCRIEDAAFVNDYDTMGRPESPAGFGEDGFHMARYVGRITAYGDRVFIANNFLPASAGNFAYDQTTVPTQHLPNHRWEFREPHTGSVLWDYGRVVGIEVNKSQYATINPAARQMRDRAYFAPACVVQDNFVYNHGHKSLNLAGQWGVIRRNRLKRDFIHTGRSPDGITGWVLTLDGFVEASAGGGGFISDNYARAMDLAGANLWIHANWWHETGSHPGNDGEGIVCQSHNGTPWTSWAVTRNVHEQGDGKPGYIATWGGPAAGMLIAWNDVPGPVGLLGGGQGRDVALIGNRAPTVATGHAGKDDPHLNPRALTVPPAGDPRPPEQVSATVSGDDAVTITWSDASDNEIGFRVDRHLGDGAWIAIAMRPPQIERDPHNSPTWIDYLAPRGTPLSYRVVAMDGDDSDIGASPATHPVRLPDGHRQGGRSAR